MKITESSFDKNVIRIPKKTIKRFEIKNWEVSGMNWGYLMTIEADKTYYFNVAKTTGEDFSTRNFFNVKENNFYGLVTEPCCYNRHISRVLRMEKLIVVNHRLECALCSLLFYQ